MTPLLWQKAKNNPKLGLKRHKFIILQFCRSEVQSGLNEAEIKVLAGLNSFWGLQGRAHLLAFSGM